MMHCCANYSLEGFNVKYYAVINSNDACIFTYTGKILDAEYQRVPLYDLVIIFEMVPRSPTCINFHPGMYK